MKKIKDLSGKYHKAVLFTDHGVREAGLTEHVETLLHESAIDVTVFDNILPEPTCDQMQDVINRFLEEKADLIVAVGGGSVMDTAKLASICAPDACSIRKMLVCPTLGTKQTFALMIPTTAGTGAEATPNAIVAVPEKQNKIGIVNSKMIPDMVILDGNMIRNLPKKIAASTGVDALAHAIECYTSRKANPFSDLFAQKALYLILNHLVPACEDSGALEAKNNMMLAAFYAGMAITSSGTTAVHALAYPLGGKYHIPHGISNAIMLLPVMRFNQPNCIREFSEICNVMGAGADLSDREKSEWTLQTIEKLVRRLEIPTNLNGFSIGEQDLEDLVTAGMEVQRLLVNNKRVVTADDARRLYQEVLA